MTHWSSLVVLGLVVLSGCYAQHEEACEPGAVTACLGSGGCAGTRQCLPDGSGVTDCLCTSTPVDAGPGVDFGPVEMGPGRDFEYVLRLVSIHAAGPAGGSRGIDLDGRASTETDAEGCFQADFMDPLSGEVGVDNAFSGLKPTIEAALGMPIDPSIEAAVTELPLSLSGVDPSLTDSRITVSVGTLEASASMREGQFQAVTSARVIVSFGVGRATLIDVGVDARLRPDGTLEDAVVTGTLRLDDAVAGVTTAVPDIDPDLVHDTLEGVADMGSSRGPCDAISIVFDARARVP